MNLVKEYLQSISGVHVYAIISMILFLAVFVMMIYHTYTLKKEEVIKCSQMPLEEDDDLNL